MKKCFFLMLGVALALTSCVYDELGECPPSSTDKTTVTFSTVASEAITTRAADASNSALGGLSNVDPSEYTLRYQLAVYSADGTTCVLGPETIASTTTFSSGATYSTEDLAQGSYIAVVWADFVKSDGKDLHYETSDFTNITCLDAADAQLNDESRDAFFAYQAITVVEGENQVSMTLTRPFAKVRMYTTDWDAGSEMPDAISITYHGCERFTNVNAVTGESQYTENFEGTFTAVIADYTEGIDAVTTNHTVYVDYLMTDSELETEIHLAYQLLTNTEVTHEYDLNINIPMRRNYLTTISGPLLEAGSDEDFNIDIDDEFGGEYDIEISLDDSLVSADTDVTYTYNDVDYPAVAVGETLQIVYSGDETAAVEWTSSNEEVATVDEAGVVTGVSEGLVTITATAVTVSTLAADPVYIETVSSIKIYVTEGEGDQEPEPEGPELTGDGTLENPYTIADALALIDYDNSYDETVYIKGIVSQVGSVNSYNQLSYYLSDDGETETQLYIYSGLGLNGENITSADYISVGDELVICGELMYYGSAAEINMKSTMISINGETEKQSDPNEKGATADNPYTVAEAIALAQSVGTSYSDYVYVKGIVSQIDEVSTAYGNATYYISDDGSTNNQLEVYRGYSIDNEHFTSENEIQKGDIVIVYGELTNYGGSTPEFVNGENYIYSIEKGVYVDVSVSAISVDGTAGTVSFEVSSNVSWSASSDNSDFTLSQTSGTGDATLAVSYTENTGSARVATITVSSDEVAYDMTVTIEQSASGQKSITWENVNSSAQTWTATTDSVYGEGYSATADGMTVGYYKGSATSDEIAPQSDHIRVYKYAELVIIVDDATSITGVTLYTTHSSSYCADMTVTNDNSTAVADTQAWTITWSGSIEGNEWEAKASESQVRINKIVVTYM